MAAKLLLAEDSLTIQKVFELSLKQTGISLTVVDNGNDAIRLAKEISPDLVVADVSLPGKDAFDVAAELGGDETGHPIPVLVLAGTLAPFNEERFQSCGAAGVLFKPFESQELIDKVETLLRGKEESVPAPEEKEDVSSSAEEPWDFSDVLSEMEEDAGTPSGTQVGGEEDLAGIATASAGSAEGNLSLGDFDVSLEDIEGDTEREEIPTEPDALGQDESVEPDPSEGEKEQIFLTEEHIGDLGFDDSPGAVTDLTPAIEEVEDLEEVDLLGGVEVPESEVSSGRIRGFPSFRSFRKRIHRCGIREFVLLPLCGISPRRSGIPGTVRRTGAGDLREGGGGNRGKGHVGNDGEPHEGVHREDPGVRGGRGVGGGSGHHGSAYPGGDRPDTRASREGIFLKSPRREANPYRKEKSLAGRPVRLRSSRELYGY
jgi:DNA-binding response OmpR family regulator